MTTYRKLFEDFLFDFDNKLLSEDSYEEQEAREELKKDKPEDMELGVKEIPREVVKEIEEEGPKKSPQMTLRQGMIMREILGPPRSRR